MSIKYKQKCSLCRRNYVTATSRQLNVKCYECQKKEMEGEIKDPKMKEFFSIPEEFYKENAFLRDIKIQYLIYERISERQIEAFKKTVERMKGERSKEK